MSASIEKNIIIKFAFVIVFFISFDFAIFAYLYSSTWIDQGKEYIKKDCYFDFDGDGFGSSSKKKTFLLFCRNGYVSRNGDCLEHNAEVWQRRVCFSDLDRDGCVSKEPENYCVGKRCSDLHDWLFDQPGNDCNDEEPACCDICPCCGDKKCNEDETPLNCFEDCREKCICASWDFQKCADDKDGCLPYANCPEGESFSCEKRECFYEGQLCDTQYRCLKGSFRCLCPDDEPCEPDLVEGTYFLKGIKKNK